MQAEQFEVLDGKNHVVGRELRSVVHSKGLRHRGTYLLIFDKKGRVFVQQRAKNKDLMPSRWDISAAEHLKPGESYEDAVVRGAQEELGIKIKNIKLLGEIKFYFEYPGGEIDDELNHLFMADFSGKIHFKDREVQQGKFIGLKQLLKKMNERPEKFTPWFLDCKDYLNRLINK